MLTTCFPEYMGAAAGNFVLSVARGLVQRGVRVHVLCPHQEGMPQRETMAGVQVSRFRYTLPGVPARLAYGEGMQQNLQNSYLAKLQVAPFVLSGVLKTLQHARDADIVHAWWTLSGAMAAPAVKLTRRPMCLTLLGSGIRSAPKMINRVALNTASGVVCSTQEKRGHLERYAYEGPVFDIKNIPDFSRLEEACELEPELRAWCEAAEAVITFVGRLSEFKDPVGFVRAAGIVRESFPGARFLLVGDGPLRREVEACAGTLGLADTVLRITGYRDDIGALLRHSTIFVANSPVTNCYSKTILEAMKLGLPVVLTDVGDPTNSFSRRDYAQLVEPGSPASLAGGILAVLKCELRQDKLGRMGQQFLEDMGFLPDIVADKTLALYRRLMGSSCASGLSGL